MAVTGKELHVTDPHGAQEIRLVEDDPRPGNRIYCIRDRFPSRGAQKREESTQVCLVGEEFEDLARFWEKERKRRVAP